jgi:hypothetical protein
MLSWKKESGYNLKHLSYVGVITGIGNDMAQILKEGGMATMNQEEGRPESSRKSGG